MSRPIKFRAWSEGKMYYQSSKDEFIIYAIEKLFSKIKGDAVLMQFTDLLDKNGKEVYEGDIVNINHPDDRTGDFTNKKGRVFYNDKEGAFYHTNENGRPPKRMFEYCEVVGNIYENPNTTTEVK